MTPSIASAGPRVVAAVLASTAMTIAWIVLALVLIGVGMSIVATWLIRSTRSDPPALAPLEVMGERRWRRADADERRTALDRARPDGARLPSPMVDYEPAGAEPDADEPAAPEGAAPEGEDQAAEPVTEGAAAEQPVTGETVVVEPAAEAVAEPAGTVDGDG